MRKNEAGLTILESGDEVRIGNGKVLYNVLLHGAESVTIVSQNTHRKQAVSEERLTLVRNVRDMFPEAFDAPAETEEDAEFWDRAEDEAQEPEITEENTSYQKAVLFALNILGKHVYAGTAKPKRRVRRLEKQARRNARKAKSNR